jgi:uncharacterized protein (DUF1330 family)
MMARRSEENASTIPFTHSIPAKGEVMKTRIAVALALVAGFGLGAVTIEGLHAQTKGPVYYVTEIDVSNPEAYTKEFAPLAQASFKKHGGRLVAASMKVTALEGPAPKRVAVGVWENMEKLKAWRNSQEMKDARKIGDKYAKFRSYAVEGIPQQ